MKPKITIQGDFFSQTGYGAHTRGLSEALSKIADVRAECVLQPGWEQNCPQWLFDAITNTEPTDVELMIATPPSWLMKLSERPKNFVGFLVFEGSRVPRQWKNICLRKDVSQIWVPSTHVYDACKEAGVQMEKVFIIPHGVDLKKFYKVNKPKELESDKFTFLFNKGWAWGADDRSGFNALLKAYTEEFKEDEPVRLLAKINTAYAPPGWNLDNEMKAAIQTTDGRPEIIITTTNTAVDKLKEFYAAGDVFVMPSKSEGFGLVAIEAMACEKPVITTGFGGQTDFVTPENGWLINHESIPAPKGIQHVIYEEARWAEPSIKHLRAIMREAFENRDMVKEKGKAALETAKKFTWKHSANRAIEALNALD